MFIWAFGLFETHRLYKARKSAGVHTAAVAVGHGVAAGGGELEPIPFWTTSAQEAVLDTVAVLCCCGARMQTQPAWQIRVHSQCVGVGWSHEGTY
jgi:hypothetical protein